ncbi:MAG: succinyl-diaminopimelate desuccinylase [Hyphomicrobiaceae bacterium]|nr:succinyl-diaminopimelate desuccinylase [Hyphomicrobiaceae bacterium]
MDARDPISLTQALIRCRSVTPDEGGALTLLENILGAYGFEVHRMTFSEAGTPDVENLYARHGLQGPNLCFAGHTDVVPPGRESAWTHPPFDAVIRDGVLYGRGAVDMKGAIACFVAAAVRVLERRGGSVRGSLSLLITGDEEGPSINGTAKVLDWLKDRDERLDACVVGEPSNPNALGDEIKIGRRGSLTARISVHGKQGHAAYPQLADNPVPKLARLIDRLSSATIDEGNANFEPTRLQVTMVDVPNTASNVIPGEAHATLNVRYNDSWTRPKMEAWIKQTCDAAAREVGARYDVTFSGTGDVFLTTAGSLVDAMTKAVQVSTGRVPQLTTGGGTSDARFIYAHCPVIEFGLVNQTIHQVDERTPVADLENLTTIYENFIETYFS